MASNQAANQPAPPHPLAIHEPSVADATVIATSPITRPNSAGALLRDVLGA